MKSVAMTGFAIALCLAALGARADAPNTAAASNDDTAAWGGPMMGNAPMMGGGAMMGGSGMIGHGGMGVGMMPGDGPMAGCGEFDVRVSGPHGMGIGGMGGMTGLMHGMALLDLSAEQNKQRALLMLAHRKEAIALSSQIETADVEVDELLLADPVNLDKVKAKVKEKHDAAAKLEMSHVALVQDLKKLLTPEQRKSLDSMLLRMGGPMSMRSTMGPAMMARPPASTN